MTATIHSTSQGRGDKLRWAWFAPALAVACALAPIAQGASTERLRTTFHELDANGDGQISSVEFDLRKIHVFTLRDANGDKQLEPREVGLDPGQFQAVDQNGDGSISGLEFVDSQLGQFETYDNDGGGALTFEELVGVVASSATAEP